MLNIANHSAIHNKWWLVKAIILACSIPYQKLEKYANILKQHRVYKITLWQELPSEHNDSGSIPSSSSSTDYMSQQKTNVVVTMTGDSDRTHLWEINRNKTHDLCNL